MPDRIKTLSAILTHWKHCREMRALLRRYPTENMRHVYWYDIPIADAASITGFFKVVWAYLFAAKQDDTAAYYGAGTMYWAPPRSPGYDEPAPTMWTCTSLKTQPFFEDDDWCRKLEANFEAIQAEYLAVQDRRTPNPASAQDVDRGHWDNVFLTTTTGQENPEFQEDCKTTLELIQGFPLCTNFGFAFFSVSSPDTHIKAHTGGSNLRLRYHLPVVVPEPAENRMRVAHETRHWTEGKAFAFDDAYDHEVWNTGTQLRALLIVDLWHPSLTADDIACLSDPLFNRFGKVAG